MKQAHENLIKIVNLLNKQEYYDGGSIGQQLHITHAAVWKMIRKLQTYDVDIQSVKGKGYYLKHPLVLLDDKKIKPYLHSSTLHLEVLEKVGSTNEKVKTLATHSKKPIVCLAETQTQGKGRLNRQWYSPFAQNIYLSLLYPVKKDVSELSGLSLICGLAICKATETTCHLSQMLSVKWPNDIMADHKKLSGIVIEIQAESHGFCHVIIGIGININMQQVTKKEINQPWTSIYKLNAQYQNRNDLCVALINQLFIDLARFNHAGLTDFKQEWKKRDYLLGKLVKIKSGSTIFSGIGAGINEQGHLILNLKNGTKKSFSSGDATLLKNQSQ